MQWLTNFFASSIGRKIIMSLTGLFLISFLVIHLIGNLQLLADDGGQSFNVYAKFMTSNPLIKTVSWGLYAGILLHAILGIVIYFKNKGAKGGGYAKRSSVEVSWASKNMALLGTLVFAFLLLHMGDFWYTMKFTNDLPMVSYSGHEGEMKNLFSKVATSFKEPLVVVAYLVGLLALAFHLWHGFQSAFQTLGLNHKKYTPIISGLGKAFSIIVPLAYAIIPIYYYLYL